MQGAWVQPWVGNYIPHATQLRDCMLQLRPSTVKINQLTKYFKTED